MFRSIIGLLDHFFFKKNQLKDIDEGSVDIAKDMEDMEYEGMSTITIFQQNISTKRGVLCICILIDQLKVYPRIPRITIKTEQRPNWS